MWLTGDGNPANLSKDMPLTSDLFAMLRKLGGGRGTEALNDIVNLIVQSGIGVNPQSITDAVLAIADICGDDPKLMHESAIFAMRVINAPQSQIKKMYLDEIDLSGAEASEYTFEELAERYARMKVRRERTVAPWTWNDKERLGKIEKKFAEDLGERLAMKDDDEIFGYRGNDKSLAEEVEKAAKKRIGGMTDGELAKRFDETDGAVRAKIANEVTQRMTWAGAKAPYSSGDAEYDKIYRRKRDYVDLAEDVVLYAEWKRAEEEGDKAMAATLKNYRSSIADLKRTLEYGDQDGKMEQIRALRKRALEYVR